MADEQADEMHPVALRMEHDGRLVALGHTVVGAGIEILEPPRWQEMDNDEPQGADA